MGKHSFSYHHAHKFLQNMIIHNPLLQHWARRHKLQINVDNFQEHLYVNGHAYGSESEHSEDEIPQAEFLPDGIVATDRGIERGNLVTPERVGRCRGDNFVERAKRMKGSDTVADPTSDSHKLVVRMHLLQTIMKFNVDFHKGLSANFHERTKPDLCKNELKKDKQVLPRFKLSKKANDLDAFITHFLKWAKWNVCVFDKKPGMRKLNSTFFREWLETPDMHLHQLSDNDSKAYIANVLVEMAHGLMDHLSVKFVSTYTEHGGLQYEFKIRAQVASLDQYDKRVNRFRNNEIVSEWLRNYATDLENFIDAQKAVHPGIVHSIHNDGIDIWKLRDIANKFEISNVQIMHLTSMGKLCEFPFLDVDDVDFLNVLLEKGGNRSAFVFHVDEEEKSYLISGDHR